MARVLVFGAWDCGPGYPRARSVLQALAATGHDVVLWRLPSSLPGTKKIDVVRRPWRWPGAAMALLGAGRRAKAMFASARAAVAPDIVVVPYPGHTMVPLLRSRFAGPIVLDLFLSAYDTAVEDRAYFRPGSLAARALLALDRRACAAADLVLLDTPAHAERVAATCGMPSSRFDWLPVGDPDAPPQRLAYALPAAPLRLLFFGTGVPLHGLQYLVEAAHRCGGVVELEVIGGGPRERAAIATRASPHIRLGPEFIDRNQLQRALAAAHLVGGVFGTSGKTQRVVPFKVVHALAAGRPVLTGDTPAVRAWLRPGEDVLVAPVGDAGALCEQLLALAADPSQLPAIAAAARVAYERTFAPAALGRRIDALLRRVLEQNPVAVAGHAGEAASHA